MDTPSFKEEHIPQVPALQLLINLGYTYLAPEEALVARGGKTSNVILGAILEKQLRQINTTDVPMHEVNERTGGAVDEA